MIQVYSKVIQFYKYVLFFFRFFSITGYDETLNLVPRSVYWYFTQTSCVSLFTYYIILYLAPFLLSHFLKLLAHIQNLNCRFMGPSRYLSESPKLSLPYVPLGSTCLPIKTSLNSPQSSGLLKPETMNIHDILSLPCILSILLQGYHHLQHIPLNLNIESIMQTQGHSQKQ